MGSSSGIRFSFVAAVYDVARYLPDFIASIEAQSFGLDRVEVIAVDDGSRDDSPKLLREWAARRPDLVTVLHKENGGQGSARNLGIEHARGEWVTFLDPDDTIDPDYLEVVDRWLTAEPALTMVATNRVFRLDATGELSDTHPLRTMFGDGDRVVDLSLEPELFHGSAPAAFVRRQVLLDRDIRFDDRIRPNFEDGHFCIRYLLAAGTSHVAFLPSARYLYRRRADGSSTLQTSKIDPARYTSVPEHGYLAVLREASAGRDYPPEWVQHFVLYELAGYFRATTAMVGTATAAHGAVGARFVEILREITQYLDPAVVEATNIAKLDRSWRDVLVHLRDERWVTPYAVVTRYDAAKKQARIVYRYRGAAPEETFVCLGRATEPVAAKVRSVDFFGVTLLHERIAWVPVTRTTRLVLDGRPVPLRPDWPDAGRTTLRQYPLRQMFAAGRGKTRQLTAGDRVLLKLAASAPVRRRYADAWVLMDRVTAADDNGERLFRYLRDHRKDVNAWFVVGEDTADWQRLKADGYDHVVAYGSRQWYLLMLNCVHLIASHTEKPVRRPPEIERLIDPAWKFTFLQHGVIKDDLSRWLNPKAIDVFVTSTTDEYRSIAGDDTPYVFTSREVVLSGLPRFDRLRELAAATPTADLVLVCPTWRFWLSPRDEGALDRTVVADFATSDYARHWLALLRDPVLCQAVAGRSLRLGFLPHPHLQSALADLDLPDWVEPLTYAGTDIQALLARTALMITDYSSMAFNAGYLDRPVVYYQFDAERVQSGGHVGVKGYYDYERDGFGPVATTHAEAVRAATELLDGATSIDYTDRAARAFPNRDGRCCERVTAAIEALT